MKKEIILTVQPILKKKGTFGLGLSTEDHDNMMLFVTDRNKVIINMNLPEPVPFPPTGIYFNRVNRRIINPKISKWITDNRLHLTRKKEPFKLIFIQEIKNNKHTYTLYPSQKFNY